jgi:hypothetical protein
VFTVRFGSVFIKKSNQTEFFFKKNRNQFKPTGFGSVFLEQKPVQTGLARFFRFGSVFFRSVLPVPSLRNRTEPVGFFKILIGFFSRFGFFGYFFRFSRFNRFFGFFEHP